MTLFSDKGQSFLRILGEWHLCYFPRKTRELKGHGRNTQKECVALQTENTMAQMEPGICVRVGGRRLDGRRRLGQRGLLGHVREIWPHSIRNWKTLENFKDASHMIRFGFCKSHCSGNSKALPYNETLRRKKWGQVKSPTT